MVAAARAPPGIPVEPGVEVEGRKPPASSPAPPRTRRRRGSRRSRGRRRTRQPDDARPAHHSASTVRAARMPTGETAPPQPSRAIAPWNRPSKGEVAIEPPPPILTAPAEPEARVAAPSRRRAPARATPAGSAARGGAEIKALPAPAEATATRKPRAPTTRKKTTTAKPAAAKKTTARKATVAKKAPAKKSTAKKATAAKKATGAKTTIRKKRPSGGGVDRRVRRLRRHDHRRRHVQPARSAAVAGDAAWDAIDGPLGRGAHHAARSAARGKPPRSPLARRDARVPRSRTRRSIRRSARSSPRCARKAARSGSSRAASRR